MEDQTDNARQYVNDVVPQIAIDQQIFPAHQSFVANIANNMNAFVHDLFKKIY